MAREELKWQNIDADDLPAEVKKSFDAMVRCSSDLYSAPLCGEWRPHELRPEHTGNVRSVPKCSLSLVPQVTTSYIALRLQRGRSHPT